MKEVRQEQVVIRQYLLGELDDEGRQQVEQRLMTERDYKEEVLMSEDELLEDFVAGELAERERELFLKNYLSAPLQKRKLAIAQALNKYAANTPAMAMVKSPGSWWRRLIDVLPPRNRFMQVAWGAMVLVVIAGSWLAFQAWQSRTQQAKLRAELERLNGPESSVLEDDGAVSHLMLTPLSLRENGNTPTLTLTAQTQIAQLRIPVPSNQYQSYQATLKGSQGNLVLNLDNLVVRTVDTAKMLVLQLPSRVFKNDDYTLTFSGLKPGSAPEEIGTYSFRVILK